MSDGSTEGTGYDLSLRIGTQSEQNGNPPRAVMSPCIQVCVLNDDQLCIGCRRRIDEIVGWPRMNRAQKLAVLSELSSREV